MDYILLAIATVCSSMLNICVRIYGEKCQKTLAGTFLYSGIYFLFAIPIAAVFLKAFTIPEFLTLLLAPLFGILYTVRMYMFYKGTQAGPLTLTILFVNISLILPLLFSVIFLGERLTMIKIIGILIIIFIIFMSSRVGFHNEKISKKWLLYAAILFFSNGLMSIIQKYHQFVLPKQDVGNFVTIGYIFASLSSFILFLFIIRTHEHKTKTENDKRNVKNIKTFIIIAVISSLCTVFSTGLYTVVSSAIPSYILFPATNCGIMIISTIFAVFMFKERLNKIKVFSMILGIMAIILLTVNF